MAVQVPGTVGEVGEFGLIDRIVSKLGTADVADVPLGPGDDAAIVSAPSGSVVVSTDMLVEGRHFRRDWSSPEDIGRKAAAQNLMDIVAMGARPTALLVAIGMPADTPTEWVMSLTEGLREEAALQGVTVVGGDVVRSERVVISVTALGDLGDDKPLTRSGVSAGQVIAVKGRIGWASAGLSILSRGFRTPRVLADAHRRPEPPYGAAAEARRGGATALIDISDGLVADLGHLAEASGVVIDIDRSLLPIADPVREAAAAFNVDPLIWVLSGGDDHAVAAAFDADTVLPEGFVVVAKALSLEDAPDVPKPMAIVNGKVPLGGGGHDHFSGV